MIAPVDPLPRHHRRAGAGHLRADQALRQFHGAGPGVDARRARHGACPARRERGGQEHAGEVRGGLPRAEEGSVLVDGREQDIANPIVARALGIGMVYQHFTLAPSMTVAENLLLAGGKTPAVIDWKTKRPNSGFPGDHAVPPGPRPRPSRAGGRRKAEAGVAQAALPQAALLILDEPTSVLTPQEADEVLGMSAVCSKRHVHGADHHAQVSRGDVVCRQRDGAAPRQGGAPLQGPGDESGQARGGHDGRGEAPPPEGDTAAPVGRALHSMNDTAVDAPALRVEGLQAQGDRGTLAVHDLSLACGRARSSAWRVSRQWPA